MIEKDVCRNPIHPGPMIRSPPQTSKCGKRPKEGLLKQILRVGGVAGQAAQVPEHLGLVRVNESPKVRRESLINHSNTDPPKT